MNLLSTTDYPDRRWWDDEEYEVDDATRELGEFATPMTAVAREALELIAHVVREDRPFTEILTADYTLVNPDVGAGLRGAGPGAIRRS